MSKRKKKSKNRVKRPGAQGRVSYKRMARDRQRQNGTKVIATAVSTAPVVLQASLGNQSHSDTNVADGLTAVANSVLNGAEGAVASQTNIASPDGPDSSRGRRKNTNMTFEKMDTWLLCRQRFLKLARRKSGYASPAETVARVVGKAVENAVAADSADDREEAIMVELAKLEAEEQPEALQRVMDAIATADELYVDDESDRQVQFSWLDKETGWTLRAKPDEVQHTVDERGGKVIRIIDDKTGSRLTSRHKRQIFFFGLVVALTLDELEKEQIARGETPERYSIQLVVRLLGHADGVEPEKREHEFWYSRAFMRAELEKVRTVCREIDAAFEAGDFPAKTSWACSRCPYRFDCAAYAQMEAARQAVIQLGTNADDSVSRPA